MITKNKKFIINNGVGEISYAINCLCPFVSFNPSSGKTTKSYIDTIITYNDPNSYCNDCSITVVDSKGCSSTLPFSLSSPCTELMVSDMTKTDLTFSIQALSSGVFTYEWYYDTTMFTGNSNSNTLTLIPIGTTYSNNVVSVKVIDSVTGCYTTKQKVFNYCVPEIEPTSVNIPCTLQTATNFTLPILALTSTNCTNPNWSNLSCSTSGFNWTNNLDGTITIPSTTKVQSANFKLNNTFVPITFTYESDCDFSRAGTIVITPVIRYAECNTTFPKTITVDLTSYVNPSNIADWASLAFVESGSSTLTTATHTAYVDANHVLHITLTSAATQYNCNFTIKNLNGILSEAGVVAIVDNCVNYPIIPDATFCESCNTTGHMTFLNQILTYQNVIVTQYPTNITISNVSINGFDWVIDPTFSGVELIKFKAISPNHTSNEFTITFDVSCAGSAYQTTTCN